ncbi:MAG TPA: hypothetical protein VHE77_04905 [Dongiaceae bacterium]|jgi:hypothetical protein|nr:hypothetical protein [Dongiaceae bacterium]
MRVILAASLFVGAVSAALLYQVVNAVGAVPCEAVFARLRIVENENPPRNANDAIRIRGLEQQGAEECRDHEDSQADDLFLQALQVIVK